MNKGNSNGWIKGFIAFVSILIIATTTVAPIVSKAPAFIFTNKIGYFIFNFYYGTLPSLLLTLAVQCVFMKLNLASEFITYALVVNLLVLVVVQFLKKIVDPNAKTFLLSGIILTAISRPLSLAIIHLASGNPLNLGEVIGGASLINQAKVYTFSTIVSIGFYYIIETIKAQYLKRSDRHVS